MRRVAIFFVVAAYGVLCFLAPIQAQEDTTAAGDQYDNGQEADSGCKTVATITGNGNKQSPVFGIKGDSFRVTTALRGDSDFLFFSMDVNKEGGGFVTSIDREDYGTDSSTVNAGPGNFFLDILAANTDYTVTVEDCAGSQGDNPGPVDSPSGVKPGTGGGDMPDTGGPPYLAVGAALLLGVALLTGRHVVGR
jgi:hypothetical protein